MCSIDSDISYLQYEDYAQSANTLFHFLTKPEYLKQILIKRALIPRYCIETIDYLNIHNEGLLFDKVAILQKCFCDIPFHKLAESFSVNGVGESYNNLNSDEKADLEKNNTHFAYYGEYAIAFSKSWGEKKNLQPIHYLNKDSIYTKDYSSLFNTIINSEDLPADYAQDVLNRLSFIKPLRGIMQRRIKRLDSSFVTVELYKNFHDECEWRYIPNSELLTSLNIESIIANPTVIPFYLDINKGLENDRYKSLWLDFSYDEIRYIIVPDTNARVDIIETILALSDTCFENQENIPMQKNIMISKILVLSEIRKDW